MSIQEKITEKIQNLPENKQQEVLVFIEFLLQKNIMENTEAENQVWSHFSIDQAMKGLEDDGLPEYTEEDLKEKWKPQ